jgi:hypothetical protein
MLVSCRHTCMAQSDLRALQLFEDLIKERNSRNNSLCQSFSITSTEKQMILSSGFHSLFHAAKSCLPDTVRTTGFRDYRQRRKERKKKSLWNIRKTLKPSIEDRIDTSTNILAYRALSKQSSLAKCFADHEASIVKTRTVFCQPSCDILLVIEIQEMCNLAVFGSHDWDI